MGGSDAIIELRLDNLEKTIEDNAMLVIDFWAGWCGPCRSFAPVFERVARKHKDVAFAKCDTDHQQDVAAQFGIRSIPTLSVFREGILLFHQPGALPEAALEQVIQKIRELDMDDIRAQIAEEEAEEGGRA